jgi:hypothetical protein
LTALTIAVAASAMPTSACAAVAVVSNRTPDDFLLTVAIKGATESHAKPIERKLSSGDLTVIEMAHSDTATISAAARGAQPKNYEIQPDAAYYIGKLPTGSFELSRIGVGTMPAPSTTDPPPVPRTNPQAEDAARTITVKILVDEEEPTRPPIWERRLRQRVAAASEILERYCGMKLKVVAVGTWQSDNSINDFNKAVAEFASKVDPGEARIAIGFTSQYQIVQGRTHLGGTRGPLARHILLREWSQYVSEAERLELLVHEIGHFLGAVHSPESDSVMRVLLGDKQARDRRFQIRYDPLNTLAMNLVAEEWRLHPLNSYGDLSASTKARLRAIYEAIDQSLPTDPAAAQYLRILEYTSGPRMIGSQ